ncbi:MAG: hypothetical protein ABIV21_02800 [Pyrinomonadaceae bacterium]
MCLFDEVDFVQTQNLPISELWAFLPLGYLVTILIETPVLLFALPTRIPVRQRLWCGAWLTACTYPIVVLVLPAIFLGQSRALYLLVAEVFAPVAECLLFWFAFRGRERIKTNDWVRCYIAVVIANLASFGLGEVLNNYGWFGLF